MSIDDQTDPPLLAVAALVRGAVEADLGADMLVAVYDDPRALQILAGGKLPAMAIYRLSSRLRRRNSAHLVRDLTLQFDYMLPATSLEKRGDRWPALAAVWDCVVDAMIEGKHPAVSSGTAVLETAGLWIEQENSVREEHGVAEGGGQAYPFLRGQMVVAFTPEELDAATLDDFLRFSMTFDKPPSAPPDGEPLIQLNVTLES